MKDLSNKLKRSKTHNYHWSCNEAGCRLYFCSSRPNLNKSRGVQKERGKVITLLDRNTSTFSYRDLPNGRYYEYWIQYACLENKQVKTISYYYAQGENARVGFDLLEDLSGKDICPTNYYFDVKGGKVTAHHIKKQKPSCSKIKGLQDTSWSKVKEATHMKSANDKIMKFYAKKFRDGKISKRLFAYCSTVRTRCDNIAQNFPFNLKDKLCDVYALYEENHPLPPPEVKVKRAEEIALEEIKEWCDQVDFALAMSNNKY